MTAAIDAPQPADATFTDTATFYDGYWAFRQNRGDHVAANRVKLRHEQAAEFLRARLALGSRVLDLGCGDGIIGQILSAQGFRVTGADVAPAALRLAAPHYADTLLLDLDGSPTPDHLLGAFDAVVCLEVLEHIRTPRENVARIFSLTRPGGLAVFSFPNIFSYKNRWSFVRGRWPHGYTTYDPREHLQVLELPAFRRWVADAGFVPLGTAITPDLPRFKPLRRAMFRARGVLNAVAPTMFAMQINLFARRPGA